MILKYTIIQHHEYLHSISQKLSVKFYQNKRFIFYEKVFDKRRNMYFLKK